MIIRHGKISNKRTIIRKKNQSLYKYKAYIDLSIIN